MTYTPPPGDVARWHAHPNPKLRNSGDGINAHQQRCLDLVEMIWPHAPESLKLATRFHDEPERWLGDMPFGTKRDNPDLHAAYVKAEAVIIKREGIPQPANEVECLQIKLADRLDALRWVRKCAWAELIKPEWHGLVTVRDLVLTGAQLSLLRELMEEPA